MLNVHMYYFKFAFHLKLILFFCLMSICKLHNESLGAENCWATIFKKYI